jgi:hypothetical protein
MSWTIQTTESGTDDMKSLQRAIMRAAAASILMFCSASDQGSHTTESCYPGDWSLCLRIGGATFAGDKLTWVDDSKVDFWFPGRNVPFRTSDGKSVVYESGSSVATAAASGLAGVLIYCARLLGGNADVYFRDRDAISRAFAKMSTGKDGKFPRTDSIFGRAFREKLHLKNPKGSKKPDIASLEWNDVSKNALIDLLNNIKVSGGPGTACYSDD